MCEFQFGQCASGLVFTTPECATANLVNVRVIWLLQHRNVRVVWFLQRWNVRVLVGPMCKCSGHNVRVIGYGRVEMCEYGDVRVR